jgi:DNA-binding response OmpR family regulator
LLFREYLQAKLNIPSIEVDVAINALDGISKIRTLIPDLIIMDHHLRNPGYLAVLKTKKENPNTVNTPVILMAHHIGQNRIIELVRYNIKKVFTKPVKIDALCSSITEILGVSFNIDETPGIIDVHVNDNIIFVEIAQGLNRDKLDLLYYKIRELMTLYDIRLPKIIVMVSDITLGFADGVNIQKMLKVIFDSSGVSPKNIRILTMDTFLRKFIAGQKEYASLAVVSNLQYAMDGLLDEFDSPEKYTEKKAEIIGEKVLSANSRLHGESMQLRFETEVKTNREDIKDLIGNLKIAVVDDDFVIQELIKTAFKSSGSLVKTYSDGAEYLKDPAMKDFDLVFLDLVMPGIDGFKVLGTMKAENIRPPVIVLSAVTHRNAVIQAFQLGIKSYLVKPVKPEAIFTKTMEILRSSF